MTLLRMLLPGVAEVGDLSADRAEVLQALADLYAYPSALPITGWVRGCMVGTLDGAAVGADGRSASISGPADRAVFAVLRGLADVVLVGAGTARAEGYRTPDVVGALAQHRAERGQREVPVLAVVTRSGHVPDDGRLWRGDGALAITCAAADVAQLRRRLGSDRVIVAGEDDVDPVLAVAQLAARGLLRVQLEGGPTLLAHHIAAERLDELCLTWSPLLVGGSGPRVAEGPEGKLRLRAAHLIEADGLLLGRWLVQP